MVELSVKYEPSFHANIPEEKFNMVMRGATYEKQMTQFYLGEIKEECMNSGLDISHIVDLFHLILNKPNYTFQLYDETGIII